MKSVKPKKIGLTFFEGQFVENQFFLEILEKSILDLGRGKDIRQPVKVSLGYGKVLYWGNLAS